MDVEIKVNFTGDEIGKAKRLFELDFEAEERDIYFGEILTGGGGPEALPLLARGVILRVRAKKTKGDVTLKLRGPDGCIDEPAWSERVKNLGDAKIEGDWADRRLMSASLTLKTDRAGRDDFAADPPTVGSLMSTEQKELAGELLVPFGQVELLGPITARKWEHESEGGVDAEEWTVDDLHFLEISVVAKDGEDPEKKRDDLLRRVRDGRLRVAQTQKPKTTVVLEHLAARSG